MVTPYLQHTEGHRQEFPSAPYKKLKQKPWTAPEAVKKRTGLGKGREGGLAQGDLYKLPYPKQAGNRPLILT